MGSAVTEALITSSVLASLALPSFILRLWIRIRIQRVGWDDIWATLAFVCGMTNVVCDWIYVILPGGESPMISMWIYMFAFTCLMWSVHISIIFSIIRIIPARERLHIYGLTIVAFFLLICFGLLAQEAIECTYAYRAFQTTNSAESYFRCSLPRASKISQLAVGCVASVISAAFPLYVLRTVRPPSRVHRLLRLLFSSSLVVSIVCSIRAVCDLVPELATWSVVVSGLQIATCVISCNVLVIVTYFYHVLGYQDRDSTSGRTERDSDNEKDDPATSSSMPQQMTLTTIEHLFSTESGYSVSVATDETVPKTTVSAVDSSC